MHPLYERPYRRLTKALPPRLAASLDLIRPSLRSSWGGPLNGQQARQAIVRDLARQIEFDRALETGTFRGTTTEFLFAVFGPPVHTVEGDLRNFSYSERRLAHLDGVEVQFGDSRGFLTRMARITASETVLIYLDAHWAEDLPLKEELEIIRDGWERAVVMIDDFAVPEDPGYLFDDYGAGKALTEDYLPDLPAWSLAYPSVASSDETGARRGSCVLFSPGLQDEVPRSLKLSRRL